MSEQEFKDKEKRLTTDSKKKEKSLIDNRLVVVALIIIGFCWLLTYSNLSMLIFKTPEADLKAFQDNMFRISLILSLLFVTAIVFIYYFRDKISEIGQKESNAIIVVDSYTQFPTIQTVAKVHHGLQLGNCVRSTPLMPYTEAGSVPTSRFFEFENLRNSQVVSYSLWRQDYVRKITTHLMYREYFGRNRTNRFWHGEQRQEQFRSIANTAASKKGKDIAHTRTQDEIDEEGLNDE